MPKRFKSLADYFRITGKTQRSLAERLDVDESYISLIVAGRRQPSLPLALQIEAATGVPVEALVSEKASA